MQQDRSADIHDLFLELINTGMGHATASLNQLLDHEIRLRLPDIRIFYACEEFRKYMAAKLFRKSIAVSQIFSGEMEGVGVLMFPVTDGKTLVNLLITGNDPSGPEMEKFKALELDAVAEVGNLIINAVQSSISDMIGLEVSCSLPQIFYQDCQTLTEMEFKDNTCLILGEITFSVAGTTIEGMVYLVYNYMNIQIILDRFYGYEMECS